MSNLFFKFVLLAVTIFSFVYIVHSQVSVLSFNKVLKIIFRILDFELFL